MNNSRCDPELLKVIALKLKKIREAQGIPQRIVYIDTDINIGKLEVGKTNITIGTLQILCKYYGITIRDFFTTEFAPESVAEEVK